MKSTENEIFKEIKEQAIFRMNEYTPRIEKCLTLLSEDEVWKSGNEASNSVGVIIVHLCGNITQYILASLGGMKDARDRDAEFATRGGYTKAALRDQLVVTVSAACEVIASTSDNDMMKKRRVQGFSLSGIGIILHVVEHYSWHTGQISFWTKLLKNTDLKYYDNIDLNQK